MLNPAKIRREHLTDLSDVATVPWEIQKVIFFNKSGQLSAENAASAVPDAYTLED